MRILFKGNQHSAQASGLMSVARGAATVLVIQISGVGLNYITQMFLARWMGTFEFGIYEYVISLTLLLSILAGLGFPVTVLRFISEYKVTQKWNYLQGLIRGSWLIIGVSSVGLSLMIGTLILIFKNASWIYFIPVLIGLLRVPVLALCNLQREMARAVGEIVLAYIPLRVIEPLLIISGAFLYRQTYQDLSSESVLIVALISLILILILQFGQLLRQFQIKFQTVRPVYLPMKWIQVSLPLLLHSVFYIILNQTDILMIGMIMNPEAVALYSVATKTAILISFVLQAVNAVVAPVFTTLYTQNNRVGLQLLVKTVAHWIFWPSLILAIGLIGLAHPILTLFGSEFVDARLPLIVLILGQLVNVGCGSVGYLMMMTGHQNQSALIYGWSALINVILNAIAIPIFGIVGAAIATAFTMAMWNIWLHILVGQYLQVYPSIIYAIFNREH